MERGDYVTIQPNTILLLESFLSKVPFPPRKVLKQQNSAIDLFVFYECHDRKNPVYQVEESQHQHQKINLNYIGKLIYPPPPILMSIITLVGRNGG